eukprot:scaffold141449_cov14-Tisochrysis_lutea.AAC.1
MAVEHLVLNWNRQRRRINVRGLPAAMLPVAMAHALSSPLLSHGCRRSRTACRKQSSRRPTAVTRVSLRMQAKRGARPAHGNQAAQAGLERPPCPHHWPPPTPPPA